MKRAFHSWEVQESSKRRLLVLLGDNRKIYTILRTVSSSGMSRTISLKMIKDGEVIDITNSASEVLNDKCLDANGFNAIRVNGSGMDMGFHLVYNLSSVLFAGQEQAGYELSQRWI
jgi:hypothetical protein